MKDIIKVLISNHEYNYLAMGVKKIKNIIIRNKVYSISISIIVRPKDIFNLKKVNVRKSFLLESLSILRFKLRELFDLNKMDSYPFNEVLKSKEILKIKNSSKIVHTYSDADLNIDNQVIPNGAI